MTEFWEDNFQGKQMMWGEEPAPATLFARDYFVNAGVKNVLIPGIGYGRNAVPFLDAGMKVVGIEISQTAIDLARNKLNLDIPIYYGSVSGMPFDERVYNGIFCYSVIHLLDEPGRTKLVSDCYNQLTPNGYMIFTAVSTKSPTYGKGEELGPHRFLQHGGAEIFFYDENSIHAEFDQYGLVEFHETEESSGMKFITVVCKKNS